MDIISYLALLFLLIALTAATWVGRTFPDFTYNFGVPATWFCALVYFAVNYPILLPITPFEEANGWGRFVILLFSIGYWIGLLLIIWMGRVMRRSALETLEKAALAESFPIITEEPPGNDEPYKDKNAL